MRYARLLATFASWVICSTGANAQSLQLYPVTLELVGQQRAASLVITNTDTRASIVQVRAFLWKQAADGDELTPTRQLVLSPPITEIPPGGTQVVRLLLREPPGASEGAYRILIDGLPPATGQSGVRMGLRFSVPVFVATRAGLEPDLSFRVEVLADGTAELVARNQGQKHARVTNPVLKVGEAKPLEVKAGLHPYVLASSERRWRVLGDTGPLKTKNQTQVVAKIGQTEISEKAEIVRP